MSFITDASSVAAEPIFVVTVKTRRCQNTYGVNQPPFGNCTAELGVTGQDRCFNTLGSCQVRDRFNGADQLYVFTDQVAGLLDIQGIPGDYVGPFPFLSGRLSFSPSEIDPVGGLGMRASVSISLADSTHHDMGIDPYVNLRDYDPMERGTFFGRWLARHPFLTGSEITVYIAHRQGDIVDLSRAQTLRYVIESISGPDPRGTVTIKAKDILKLADGTRAQFPAPSPGVLAVAIDDSATQMSIAPEDVIAAYPGFDVIFKVRIGDEIMRVKRDGSQLIAVSMLGNESIVGRGIDGTTRGGHREETTIQLVRDIPPSSVPAILQDLLVNFAGIPSSFVDGAQWSQIQGQIGFLFSGQVSEPEPVKDLIEQLLESAGAFAYYDERDQKIKLGSTIPTPDIESLPRIDEDRNIIADSASVTRLDDARLSQVWYHRGMINSTESVDDSTNYTNRLISRDFEAETSDQYGQPRIEKIWARWTPPEAAGAAFVVAGRRLNRYRKTPRAISFQTDTKDAGFWQGQLVAIQSRQLQGIDGSQLPVPFQIVRSAHAGLHRMAYKAIEYDVDQVGEFGTADLIVIDQDMAATANILNIYISTIGALGNAGPVITVLVLPGVRVRGFPGMKGGGFPESKIRLINRGVIAGQGGPGGSGGGAVADPKSSIAQDGAPGGAGGNAIVMDEDWEIVNEGSIYGGAGGGGGGGAGVEDDDAAGGGGGGPGRDILGSPGGAGGAASSVSGDASPGSPGTASTPAQGGEGGDGGNNNASGGLGGNGGNDWASSGTAGASGSGSTLNSSGGAGGGPGSAIEAGGFDLDIIEEGEIIGVVNA